MKKRIGVIFGGKSPEHEVSVITGLQVIENIDKEKFDVLPIYVAKDGRWFSGPELLKIETYRNLGLIPEKSTQEAVIPSDTEKSLMPVAKSSLNPFKKSENQTIDVLLPTFHGGIGESGSFQGMFDIMNIPYVGPSVLGGALSMDKVVMKQLFLQNNLPITKYLWFNRRAFEKDRNAVIKSIEKDLKYPLFVKPSNGGSSIGTTKAHDKKELENAIEVANLFDRRFIVEESFENSIEINISVIGNTGSELMVSVCEEVYASGEVLTYEDKYVGGGKKTGPSKGMASTKRKVPAELAKEVEEKIQKLAKLAFEVLESSGVARVDFLVNKKTKDVVILEINNPPGSMAYYLWEASGLSFKDMLSKLTALALERYEDDAKNTKTFSSNILQNFNLTGAKGKA
ncbi:MAG TPA: D-alanine--D-alanine ligase family protein [Candidatus Saccharimonadales bacterium]|nr:D-alanine--D-alanine ligase family protein [Candidatus Saccharimonadales bacterium]